MQIYENLKKNTTFTNAQNIACYFPIGSEVNTHDNARHIEARQESASA